VEILLRTNIPMEGCRSSGGTIWDTICEELEDERGQVRTPPCSQGDEDTCSLGLVSGISCMMNTVCEL
jgi:hypothetical protein